MLTRALIETLCPDALTEYVDSLTSSAAGDIFAHYGITATPQRLAACMANVCAETGDLTVIRESMNYTSAGRLVAVWPSRFNLITARAYVRNPIKLAEKVYGGRMGNTRAGDGWDYRGGGPLQTTGREGYRKLAKSTGIPFEDHPELIEDPEHWPIIIALEWAENESGGDLSRFADQGNFMACCNAINRGNPWSTEPPIGWTARQNALHAWTRALGTTAKQIPDAETYREGMPRCEDVKAIQERLTALNYAPGPADGIFGPRLTRAALSFQANNGLTTDGMVGPETLRVLFSGSAKPFPPSNAQREGVAALRLLGDPDVQAADHSRAQAVTLAAGSALYGLDLGGFFDEFIHGADALRGMGSVADGLVLAAKSAAGAAKFGAENAFWFFGILAAYWAWSRYKASLAKARGNA